MRNQRSFASDNNAGVHPDILGAIQSANDGHVVAYGDDSYTAAAVAKFREHFGEEVDVYFVFGGTGANVLGLKSLTSPYHAVVCAETAHINVDECGAPENYAGCKLLTLPAPDGKINAGQIEPLLHAVGIEHHAQPKVISVSQSTEMGTVYGPREIKELTDFAHRHGLLLHMDGARLANAAAHLGVSLRDITSEAGVDVLSFGGTKNGMMYGEAVVFFDGSLSRDFKFIRKQGMQLSSKMRFIAAQFTALLSDDLWRRNAAHANRMAMLLADAVSEIPRIRLTQKVESNAVFATLPREFVPVIQREYFFYVWNETASEVRWMTSFDTTEDDIRSFVELLKKVAGSGV
ncbi:MAG: low specificity L-threonine aldolase [Acidobacteria bacterium]|nr:low specificity L-threonine aldolase [Acidobacteriota bacterium]